MSNRAIDEASSDCVPNTFYQNAVTGPSGWLYSKPERPVVTNEQLAEQLSKLQEVVQAILERMPEPPKPADPTAPLFRAIRNAKR